MTLRAGAPSTDQLFSPWLLLLLLAGLLQSAFLSQVTLFGVHPNLVLALVVLWGMLRGGRAGLLWAFVGGIELDLYSVTPFGTFTVALLVIALLVGFADALPFRPTALVPASFMFLLSPLFHFIAMVMMQSLGWEVAWARRWSMLPASALLDATLVLLLFRPLRRLSQAAGQRSIDWRRDL